MNKNDVLKILKELDFPTDEFYLLSGGSLVLRGIRDVCSDVDLCISTELFEQIKDKYHLTDDKKNDFGFYRLSDNIEVVVNDKDDFKYIRKARALLESYPNFSILLSVDGGINNETRKKVGACDIVVSGSYILKNSNYQDAINSLR